MQDPRIIASERKRFTRICTDALKKKYGRGKGSDSAWAAMTSRDRRNAAAAEAAFVILSWPEDSVVPFIEVQRTIQAMLEAVPDE